MLRIRIRMDPELLPGSEPELLFRIRSQPKMKEQINKNCISNLRPVNSGLCVQYCKTIKKYKIRTIDFQAFFNIKQKNARKLVLIVILFKFLNLICTSCIGFFILLSNLSEIFSCRKKNCSRSAFKKQLDPDTYELLDPEKINAVPQPCLVGSSTPNSKKEQF